MSSTNSIKSLQGGTLFKFRAAYIYWMEIMAKSVFVQWGFLLVFFFCHCRKRQEQKSAAEASCISEVQGVSQMLGLSTMINTYQSSLAPPPLPPRLDRSHPVLITQPLRTQGHVKPLTQFLLGVVFLNLFLSIGGFIYLYYNGNKVKHSPYSWEFYTKCSLFMCSR